MEYKFYFINSPRAYSKTAHTLRIQLVQNAKEILLYTISEGQYFTNQQKLLIQ